VEDQVFDTGRMLSEASGAITAKRVFGKAYERNGVTVIPAARVGGGFGGGGGTDSKGKGNASGTGFGLGMAGRPVGAFVIQNGKVRWKAALDLNTIVLRTQAIAAAALLTWGIGAALRRRR
jgi:uncharacterized spore protein YtfJ